jgi:hypothetical protein
VSNNANFVVKNGLVVNGAFTANSTTVNAAAVNAATIFLSTTATVGNVVVNTSTVSIGTNVNLTTSELRVGNSTVNTSLSSGSLVLNGINVNTAITGNATAAYSNAITIASNATNLTSGTLATARLPATVNVATTINVGANVSMNTTSVFVTEAGNTVSLSSTFVRIGNSTVNTALSAGSITLNGTNVNTAITSNASTAYANAITIASNATNLTTGTLPTARLSGTYAITANNATNLNGQAASFYTNIPARLGYTPVNRAGDTMTGQLNVPYLAVSAQGGAEGGEIQLARPLSSTSLAAGVIIDIASNSLRIFEAGGAFRGATLDITACGSQSALLHSTNFNSFAPSLSGAGAFGTWGINITGNAVNATNLNGQAASFYTNIPARLGYTPVNRAGDTMTGALNVPYYGLISQAAGGTTGGGVLFALPPSGTSIAGPVSIDVESNFLRIFENGGSFRGVTLNIPGCGSQSELLHSNNISTYINTEFNITGNAPKYACRAWVNFDGTTAPGTIRNSGNISSVTRNSTGNYTVNFSTAMPDANYAATSTGSSTSDSNRTQVAVRSTTSSSLELRCGGTSGTGTFNEALISVSVFR